MVTQNQNIPLILQCKKYWPVASGASLYEGFFQVLQFSSLHKSLYF